MNKRGGKEGSGGTSLGSEKLQVRGGKDDAGGGGGKWNWKGKRGVSMILGGGWGK